MLPIILKAGGKPVGLTGAGEGLARRRKSLVDADLNPLEIAPNALGRTTLGLLSTLFVAGLPKPQATAIASAARMVGVLVHVEDEPELCDFYMPTVIWRGDLVISVSTSGKSPGLAKLVRQWIERQLGPAWADHVADAAEARKRWREDGLPPEAVARKTAMLVAQRRWLS